MKAFRWLALTSAAVLIMSLVTSCAPPPHGPSIDIQNDSWTANPAAMEIGADSFSILVSNSGLTPQEFVVVGLTGAQPDELPMRDGMLDMAMNQSTFYVAHPEPAPNEGRHEGPEFILVPDRIDPDQEEDLTIRKINGDGETGTYVVMSSEPGGYEAGKYAVFTITG